MFTSNTKGIGPVIASGLLLVVAIVAVVTFQTWFNSYSTEIFSDVETQSGDSVGNTQIENILGTTLYFNNGGKNNLTLTEVKVAGNSCILSTNQVSSGLNSITLTNCTSGIDGTTDIVVVTNKGIYSKKLNFKSNTVEIEEEDSETISLTFSSNATYIFNGSSINLSWITTNANSCFASAGWSGSKSTSDSLEVFPIENTTYYLNCSNSENSLNYSVDVYVFDYDSTADPYWDYVYLLLDFESGMTDTAKSQAMSETGTNARTSSNAKVGSYSFRNQNGGGNNYFVTPSSTSLYQIGTEDFTLEAWVYPETATAQNVIFSFIDDSHNGAILSGMTRPSVYIWPGGASTSTITTSLATSTWNHVAMQRTSDMYQIYVNGILEVNSTLINTISNNKIMFGDWLVNNPGARDFHGYIDEIRFTKGIARYGTSFTPLTTAYPTEGTIFLPSTNLEFSSNTSSILFGGSINLSWTSEYIDSCEASGDWSGTKSAQGSEVISNINSNSTFNLNCSSALGSSNDSINIVPLNSFNVSDAFSFVSNTSFIYNYSSILLTWSSNNSYSCEASGDWSGDKGNSGTTVLSPTSNSTYSLNCSNDFQSYEETINTSTFWYEESSDPYWDYVYLLLDFESGMTDTAKSQAMSETGTNARTSSNAKVGSYSFRNQNGAGNNYFVTPSSTSLYQIGTDDYTLEAWVYPETAGAQNVIFSLVDDSHLGAILSGMTYPSVYLWGENSGTSTVSTSLATSTWHHVAMQRSGDRHQIYVDGVLEVNSTPVKNIANNKIMFGDWLVNNPGNRDFHGYIDEIRFTKGIARYGTSFTPLTTTFPTVQEQDLILINSTLSSNITTISSGDSINLSWSSIYADSCEASGDWSGSKAIINYEIISNIVSTSQFNITCSSGIGSSNSSVTITVS